MIIYPLPHNIPPILLSFNSRLDSSAGSKKYPEILSFQFTSNKESWNYLFKPPNPFFLKGFGGAKRLSIVVPLGFEPRAAGLENLCSIQLSYGTSLLKNPRKGVDFKEGKGKKRSRTGQFALCLLEIYLLMTCLHKHKNTVRKKSGCNHHEQENAAGFLQE